MSQAIVIERKHYPGLVGDLESGKIDLMPWMSLEGAKFDETCRDIDMHYALQYKWQIPLAKKAFGKPDGYFTGEWRYAVYMFTARRGEKTQDFVLWADPKSARKGSSFELVSPGDIEFVLPIIEWLVESHPDFKNPPE